MASDSRMTMATTKTNGATSIVQFSDYGNPYSILSAYNVHSSTPPFIILKGKIYGRLSKNQFLEGIIINPDRLVEWMHKLDLY